jgi:hypothetical protein
VAYNSVTTEPKLTAIIQGKSSPSDYHLFTVPKRNFDGHKFKDGREVEAVVTRWLITQDGEVNQRGTDNFVQQDDKCVNWRGLCGKVVQQQWN